MAEESGKATLSDLKDVLKETLDARGSLGQIKARIRAEIFAALDEQDTPKPKLSNENLIINELIREYLEYNGYRHALSVFLPESGQPVEKPFHRSFLSNELNIVEDTRYSQVPLLYSIVANLQQAKERNVSASIDRSIEGFRNSEAALTNQEDNVENKYRSSEQGVVGGSSEPSPLVFTK